MIRTATSRGGRALVSGRLVFRFPFSLPNSFPLISLCLPSPNFFPSARHKRTFNHWSSSPRESPPAECHHSHTHFCFSKSPPSAPQFGFLFGYPPPSFELFPCLRDYVDAQYPAYSACLSYFLFRNNAGIWSFLSVSDSKMEWVSRPPSPTFSTHYFDPLIEL